MYLRIMLLNPESAMMMALDKYSLSLMTSWGTMVLVLL